MNTDGWLIVFDKRRKKRLLDKIKAVHLRYEENFKLLDKYKGTRKHDKYLKIADELESESIALVGRGSVRCPLSRPTIACETCSKWVVEGKTKRGERIFRQRREGEKGGVYCREWARIRKEAREGFDEDELLRLRRED